MRFTVEPGAHSIAMKFTGAPLRVLIHRSARHGVCQGGAFLQRWLRRTQGTDRSGGEIHKSKNAQAGFNWIAGQVGSCAEVKDLVLQADQTSLKPSYFRDLIADG